MGAQEQALSGIRYGNPGAALYIKTTAAITKRTLFIRNFRVMFFNTQATSPLVAHVLAWGLWVCSKESAPYEEVVRPMRRMRRHQQNY